LSSVIEQYTTQTTAVPGYGDRARPAQDRGTGLDLPDRAEELANSITHGVGMVLSIAGLYALFLIAGKSDVPGQAIGCKVFGMSLVLLYTASTLYHSWRDDQVKRVLLLLDHIGIYILIAGTYTPLALVPLRGRLGWAVLIVVWGFALVGSLAKVCRVHRLDEDSPLPYVAMSWMVLATSGRLAMNVSPGVFEWLLAGGIFYTIGLVFFVQRDRRFHHAIWHLFVLAGSICHFRAVIGFTPPVLS
jgi:hemolysin III